MPAQERRTCSVGCHFGFESNRKSDAAFGLPQQSGTASVLRSMESSQYYSENNIAQARRWVSTINVAQLHLNDYSSSVCPVLFLNNSLQILTVHLFTICLFCGSE